MAVPEAGYFRLAVETGEKESGHAFVIHNVIPWISSPALRLSLCSFLLTLLGGGLDQSKVTEFGLLLLLGFVFFLCSDATISSSEAMQYVQTESNESLHCGGTCTASMCQETL